MTNARNFCAWRDRKFFWLARPKQNSPGFFLQLRWSKHERPPTKAFLRLARWKFFDWCDRSISFRRQKSICDWRDRSTSDSLPQFFCNWGDCSTSERGPKCFPAWRDRNFLRLEPVEAQVSANRKFLVTGSTDVPVTADGIVLPMARTKQNYHRQKFLRLVRPMQKCTPTEVFLHLARPNLFLTGADEAQVSADRFFSELRRAKY